MAGNLNSAPRALWRKATKFTCLLVRQRATKQDTVTSTDWGDDPALVGLTVQAAPGQTADAIQVLDYLGNKLLAVSVAGNLTGVVHTATVALTAANLIAMNATPVTLIAAPGAGFAIVDVSLVFEMIATATAFTGGGAVSLQYNGGTVNPLASTVAAAVVTAGAGTTLTQVGPNVTASGIVVPANKAVEITNATAAFATGTGTAKAFLRYRVITL